MTTTPSLTNLANSIGGWANSLPALWRKRIYNTAKVLSALGALAAIVLPELPSLGIQWSGAEVATTVATVALAFLGHLAASNTVVDPTVDVTPAPETTEPVNPAEVLKATTPTP